MQATDKKIMWTIGGLSLVLLLAMSPGFRDANANDTTAAQVNHAAALVRARGYDCTQVIGMFSESDGSYYLGCIGADSRGYDYEFKNYGGKFYLEAR